MQHGGRDGMKNGNDMERMYGYNESKAEGVELKVKQMSDLKGPL